MAPKRATRSTPVTTTPAPTATTTTSVTNAQLQAMIDQGVTAALAARDANRNGDDSHTSGTGGRRTERVARECTYQDFIKCKPLYFKGTEGVADLRKKMTDKYCPRNEMKKLEAEFVEFESEGMFSEESDKIERYVCGLPDMIHGNIVASKPKTMQEAVEMDTELIDKKVSTIAERQAENKRKFENTSRNNQNQQQNKRQNIGRAYTARTGEKKPCRDLNLYALNATITRTVRVLQNATNATNLAILPMTVGVQETPTMLTIRGALGQARNLLASSVEFKDTLGGNVQS
ncbi:hypothetical protein Tco_0722825 [Tanacetum coccineum]